MESESGDSILGIMVMAIFGVAGIAVLAPRLQQIFSAMPSAQHLRYLQAQEYRGLTDDRTLNATPTIQWLNLISDPPYIGWISASFFNDGPKSVFIGVNNPNELRQIGAGSSLNVDMTGADRRIEFVFYKCNKGEKASVGVIGKY